MTSSIRPSRTALLIVVLAASSGTLTAAEPPEVSPLAGSWTWEWTDPEAQKHRHVLEVEGVGGVLAAREVFDGERPVKATGLKFDGKSVKFTVIRGNRRADYSGKLEGQTLRGTVLTTSGGQTTEYPWKAERVKTAGD